uniref:Uncharacterized protein n=1 Tax=Phlebotomus papatasi TaxID=29031 RepID=A0A1B0DM10_PHLPP
MKTVISKILRHFTLHPVAGKQDIKPSFRVTLRATGGLFSCGILCKNTTIGTSCPWTILLTCLRVELLLQMRYLFLWTDMD